MPGSGSNERRRSVKPSRTRTVVAWLAVLALSLPAVGAAQTGETTETATGPTYTYDIIQFGQTLGQTTLSVARGPTGYTTTASVTVAGLFQADNQLIARPDGSALTYTIEGTAQGAEFRIDAEFTDAGADLTLSQGGATPSMSVPSEAPFYVFDNNFLEGYQLAADQVMASGQQQVFAALVPQTVAVATLGFDAPKPGTVEYLGATLDVTQIDVALAVAGQALAIKLYLDGNGQILVLEQQPGAVRFVRQPDDGAAEEATEVAKADVDRGDKPAAQAGGAPNGAPAGTTTSASSRHRTAEEALLANAHCVTEREVSVTSTGETLFGRLTLPLKATGAGATPAPTLVLLPGSGAVDMDGNAHPLIVNGMYKQLAFELACHGYGALRVAKLGISPSTGDGNAVTLSTYSQNTADWLAFLAQQPGVDAARLGVLGHSEGGLVALHGAAQDLIKPAVVVLLATPGRPLAVLLREQLLASFERSGITGETLDELVRQTDEAIQAIGGVEGTALALEGDLADNQIAASFAHAAGLLRSEMEHDPAQLARRVQVPTLVMQGLKDLQVQQVDGRNLAAGLPRGTLLELPDMSHNLVRVPGDPESGIIPAADAVVSATLVQSLVTWLNGHLRTAR